MESFCFTIFGIIFCILLMIIYFPKKKIYSLENKIYGIIIVVNFISCLADIYSFILVSKGVDSYNIAYLFTLKIIFSCLLGWIYFFTVYILIVTIKDKMKEESLKQLIKNSILFFFLIVAVDVFFLPITVTKSEGGLLLPTGAAVNLIYGFVAICVVIMLIIFFKNIKNMRNKKFIPLYLLIVMFGVIVLVQKLFPELIIIDPAFVFITFVMYFTIENPDVKMIEELDKNRILVNKTMEDKSNFLFLASSQIKRPIDEIINIADSCINTNDKDEIIDKMKEISNKGHNLSILVNNVMDISSLSNLNIKMIEEKYNLKNLLSKIKLLEEKKVNEDIEFRFNISDNIPELLYGDSKLLEQILISALENSIKYTQSGFIELRLNTIEKYDMVRLVFTIEDSGLGMTTSKVNELLSIDSEFTEEELKRLETNNVNMNTIKKLVSKLGGYFTIKSEVNKGTEIKFVIDQRIVSNNYVNLNNLTNKDKILVATKNNELKDKLTNILEKKGYIVETSIYSNDILDRIRLKEEYEYIFIDDDMDKRALEVLKELRKNPKFKMKVIIMIDDSLEMIKDHFKEDGFMDYLIKDNLEKDLRRVIN